MTKEQYNFNAFKALAAQALAHKSVPTKKHEEWRYSDITLVNDYQSNSTSITPIEQEAHTHTSSSRMRESSNKSLLNRTIHINKAEDLFDGSSLLDPRIREEDDSVKCLTIPIGLDVSSYYIAVVNGVLDHKSSRLPTKGIVLRNADLSTINLQHGFDSKYQALQTYSQMASSLLIEVTTTLYRPLKIYYLNTSNHVTLIKITDNAQVTIHEEMDCRKPSLINHVTKLELGDNAKCKHFKHHSFSDDVRFLYSSKVSCKAGSQYRNYALNFGCQSYRQDSEAELLGPKASCSFYGANIGKGQQNYDVIVNVKHNSPQTSSSQHYNQVLADRAKGSFYTKVEIPKGLHAVTARQLNKNLLLNEQAQAFSRPELDIHSDDVACSHGATIGHIDADALAYLKSRGLDQLAAEKLILQGFLVSVFDDKGLDEEEHKALTSQIMEHVR